MNQHTGHITEEKIIALLIRKDIQAIDIIYEKYSPALYGVILRIVRSEEAASDVLQDSFVKIWKNMDAYDQKKGRLFTWLLNIARNTAIDVTRSKGHKLTGKFDMLDSKEVGKQSSNSTVKIDHIGMKELVGKLNPDHKVIIDLLYFSGYTQAEVSKELQIPLGTVKTRAKSAMNQLRQIFEV